MLLPARLISWGLRDYGLEPQIWDEAIEDDGGICEHEWGDIQPEHHPGQVEQTKWKDAEAAGKGQTAGSGQFCIHCNAWFGSLGSEPRFELYIQHLKQIFTEVKRVLKKTGTCFVNLGDSYSGSGKAGKNPEYQARHTEFGKPSKHKSRFGMPTTNCSVPAKSLCLIPERFAIMMVDELGWVLRNKIIWWKRNCLSGGTRLYSKTQKGTIPSTLKDLVRLNPSTVKLWDGEKWNQVAEWLENKGPQDIKRITLRSSEVIKCTGEHIFPTETGNIHAHELAVGDVIKSTILPDNKHTEPEHIPDEIGWFVGMYIAEGSKSGKCIQIASHVEETDRFSRLQNIAEKYHGTCRMYSNCRAGYSATINIHSDLLSGIIDEYIGGRTSHDKHLTTKAWQRNNRFLSHLLDGYLEGDGHEETKNSRWRLGFTRNDQWAYNLRCICARLGYKIKLFKRTATCVGKVFKTYQGELRKVVSNHRNTKSQYEIVKIERGKNSGKFWDIILESEPHLFSTISGTLIHNCMPSSAKDRYTVDFEDVFFFTKSKKYWFKQQFEAIKMISIERSRRDNNENKYSKDEYFPEGVHVNTMSQPRDFKGYDGVTEEHESHQGRNKRCVWDITTKSSSEPHFAMFPHELVEPMLSAGCPPGGIVLDPFAGMCTVASVAIKQRKKFIMLELSPIYAKKGQKRLDEELKQLDLFPT